MDQQKIGRHLAEKRKERKPKKEKKNEQVMSKKLQRKYGNRKKVQ